MTITATTNQAATGIGDVIEAMRSIQNESDRWHLAESLQSMIPSGSSGFSDIVDQATTQGVGGGLSANTLRLYRDTAVRWPAADRVPNVSFSAHREAMVLPSIKEAAKMLHDLAKNQGADKVTVASVRKAIAVKSGKVPAGQSAGGASTVKAPAAPAQSSVLSDLMAGGPQLIAAIPVTTTSTELDKLHAGLTKTIGHVERLRAKAARKVAADAKKGVAAARSAVKKASPTKAAATKKAQGDLRGL